MEVQGLRSRAKSAERQEQVRPPYTTGRDPTVAKGQCGKLPSPGAWAAKDAERQGAGAALAEADGDSKGDGGRQIRVQGLLAKAGGTAR